MKMPLNLYTKAYANLLDRANQALLEKNYELHSFFQCEAHWLWWEVKRHI